MKCALLCHQQESCILHCTNCGTVLQPGVANCTNCGAPVIQTPAAGAASYAPTIAVPPQGTPPPVANSYANAGYVPPVGQPAQPNYGYPQGQAQGGYPPVPGSYVVAPAVPKKRSRIGLIIGIIGGVLLLACVGIVLLVPKGTTTGTSGGTTPAATPTIKTPSGQAIVPAAAAIVSNAKTTSAVDADYNPTSPTTTFKAGDKVYVTFNIQSGDNDGYVQTKWYLDGKVGDTKIFHHTHGHNVAVSSISYPDATTQAGAELYWCTKADCSDAQLAQAVRFTVGATSFVPTRPALGAIQDADRRLF